MSELLISWVTRGDHDGNSLFH